MGYGAVDGPRRSDSYIDLQKKNIIGIEVQIKSMTGKFKMSQEKIKGDRDGVIKSFESLNSAAGAQMAVGTIRRQEGRKTAFVRQFLYMGAAATSIDCSNSTQSYQKTEGLQYF